MGKTAVFVLTILNRMEESASPVSCLVLAHTRELAYQIEKEFSRFIVNLKLKTMVIYGGEPVDEQIKTLNEKKPQVVVGTPGRVLSLAKKGQLDLKSIKFFILDECDKMLKELGILIKLNFKI